MKPMKKIKIGSIVLIPLDKGYRIAQVTHRNQEFGHLIRVMANYYSAPPSKVDGRDLEKIETSVFFPVQTAVNQGLVDIIGHEDVSASSAMFPIFKTRMIGKNGDVGPWWLWDGDTEWEVGYDLSETEMNYPDCEIVSFPRLVEIITPASADSSPHT